MRLIPLVLIVFATAPVSSAAAQRATPRPAELVVGVLRVRGSYARDVEVPADTRQDTVQWFIDAGQTWQIRTYATDHDIHIYSTGKLPGDPIRTAVAHIRKHYATVLDTVIVVHLPGGTTTASARHLLEAAGLSGELEVAPAGFAFLSIDSAQYRTKSTPKAYN